MRLKEVVDSAAGGAGRQPTFGLAVFVLTVPLSPPAAPTRIRLASSLEVNYWCQTLNCTETHLRNAVLAVGPLAADVRAYLAR